LEIDGCKANKTWLKCDYGTVTMQRLAGMHMDSYG